MKEYIAVIDSGVGGLTVAKEIMKQMPLESILYFGDTKRCPYGDRTDEEIVSFSMEMVRYIEKFPLKALVIACNTATVVALQHIQRYLKVPVIGVVQPGAKMASLATRNNQVAVLATTKTIESRTYEKFIHFFQPRVEVKGYACPWLAPLIEKGIGIENELEQALNTYLSEAKEQLVDTVVLGCTHYPLVRDQIQVYFGGQVQLIDPAIETVKELKKQIVPNTYKIFKNRYYVSGDAEMFKKIADTWLGRSIEADEVSIHNALERKEL